MAEAHSSQWNGQIRPHPSPSLHRHSPNKITSVPFFPSWVERKAIRTDGEFPHGLERFISPLKAIGCSLPHVGGCSLENSPSEVDGSTTKNWAGYGLQKTFIHGFIKMILEHGYLTTASTLAGELITKYIKLLLVWPPLPSSKNQFLFLLFGKP